MASSQSASKGIPAVPVKQTKRKLRMPLNNKKINRLSTRPATLLVRPSITNVSTILPHPPKPILLANQMTPIISKSNSSIQANPTQPCTTYLVVDGSQGQFVQVANDGQQPVTFRNQAGHILQATPINVVSAAAGATAAATNQPVHSSFPINGDCSLLSNSSQTVTTVRTSSSIDMQQQTMLTSDTTTMTTQKLTGIIHPPSNSMISATILNGNNLQTYDKNSSLDATRTSDSGLSLSLAQLAQKVNRPRRRSSSSSVSKKKRGRPRLYERDPFTNKPMKSHLPPETTEITLPNLTTSTVLVPATRTTFNNLQPHTHSYNSIIFPNQSSAVPQMNSSLLQQHHYSYPSLLNNNTTSTNILAGSTFNIYPNTPSLSTTFPYSSQSTVAGTTFSLPSISSIPETQPVIPLKTLQIPTTSTPMSSSSHSTPLTNVSPSNISPIKSQTNDIAVHYIGGFVIRESTHPFSPKDKVEQKENPSPNNNRLQCIICKTADFSARFFDPERQFCSKLCSDKSNERFLPFDKMSFTSEPIRVREKPIENVIPPAPPPIQSNIDEQLPLAPDHGLPADPSKWTVFQVGEFVTRLTNTVVRDAFYESEMDGQALLLMTQEHLRDTLKIKLGPSLIIASEIAKLRDRSKTFSP